MQEDIAVLYLGMVRVTGRCTLYARQKMSIWPLLLPISQIQINGLMILDLGEEYEMHVLPSSDGKEHRTISH